MLPTKMFSAHHAPTLERAKVNLISFSAGFSTVRCYHTTRGQREFKIILCESLVCVLFLALCVCVCVYITCLVEEVLPGFDKSQDVSIGLLVSGQRNRGG